MKKGIIPFRCDKPQLQETHISYVVLCDKDVLKFKKNITLDFLDFSTLALRRYYCEEEYRLNNRFSSGIYLGVLPVSEVEGVLKVSDESNIIDYAVHMKRMPSHRRMDILLSHGQLDEHMIRRLAERLAAIHEASEKFFGVIGIDENQVNDLINYQRLAGEVLGLAYAKQITDMCEFNKRFIHDNSSLLRNRAKRGFTRDCHGDLHTRNIFILDEPVVYDCIEFSPSLRRIDLLSDVAFLCMDLEVQGCQDFSSLLFQHYNQMNPICNSNDELELFLFFKAYRANVRAKISLLSVDRRKHTNSIREAKLYLDLMIAYKNSIRQKKTSDPPAPR